MSCTLPFTSLSPLCGFLCGVLWQTSQRFAVRYNKFSLELTHRTFISAFRIFENFSYAHMKVESFIYFFVVFASLSLSPCAIMVINFMLFASACKIETAQSKKLATFNSLLSIEIVRVIIKRSRWMCLLINKQQRQRKRHTFLSVIM